MSDAEMEALHEFASQRGIQLVSDEVYHPIYHGRETQSAAHLPHATVINDLSKAFPLAGTRTGWMIERDARRREHYLPGRRRARNPVRARRLFRRALALPLGLRRVRRQLR